MAGKSKHSPVFWLSLLGVFALMALYVWGMSTWLGQSTKENDIFQIYYDFLWTNGGDLAELSDYEAGLYPADDTAVHEISLIGEKQEIRNKVLETSYSAETYISSVNGKRCARYKYRYEGMSFVVIYDASGIENHPANTERYAYINDNLLLLQGDEDVQ